ncbi:MAG: YihY/virulence factor BrkB family protein [Actinomycetota bacterium]|nr:YihY/virulence factor BrkB family protein [Actinomycetota bacterium]
MSTASMVPVTIEIDGEELDFDDARTAIRSLGVRKLLVDSSMRFRYGDGFTNSRALALQVALSVVPFMLALTGLAADLDVGRASVVLSRTVSAMSVGGDDASAAPRQTADEAEEAGEVALAIGLVFALVSMTTAVAQIERGVNRIYGIERDRRAAAKYGRAAVLTAILAVPVGVGFMLLVGGGPFADAMVEEYGWTGTTVTVWHVVRWPAGTLLLTFAIAVLFDHVPRRRQPSLSWLALGSGIAVALTITASGLLALYVRESGAFDDVYGSIAGVMALLLWSYLTSIALFVGAAVAAQLEAVRAGVTRPYDDDPGPAPGSPDDVESAMPSFG